MKLTCSSTNSTQCETGSLADQFLCGYVWVQAMGFTGAVLFSSFLFGIFCDSNFLFHINLFILSILLWGMTNIQWIKKTVTYTYSVTQRKMKQHFVLFWFCGFLSSAINHISFQHQLFNTNDVTYFSCGFFCHLLELLLLGMIQ